MWLRSVEGAGVQTPWQSPSCVPASLLCPDAGPGSTLASKSQKCLKGLTPVPLSPQIRFVVPRYPDEDRDASVTTVSPHAESGRGSGAGAGLKASGKSLDPGPKALAVGTSFLSLPVRTK